MPGRIVCFGELLLRLGAPGRQFLLQSPHLDVHVGGDRAERLGSHSVAGREQRAHRNLCDRVERGGAITGSAEGGHDWVAVGCIRHNQVQAAGTPDGSGTINHG